MSLLRQKRAKSAGLAGPSSKIQKRKRYDKIQTESSHSFKPVQGSRPRTYSRQSLKKGKISHGNMLSSKEPEQMIEQNLNLKIFINNLQEQLSLQRGRLQMNKRKTQKYVKQFNRQFDKELYYSGKNPHSYMFSGIKQQYQNIKHLYEMKCLELEKYAQSIENTNIEELIVYAQTLQQDNMLLRQKLQQLIKEQYRRSMRKQANMKQKHSEVQKLYTNYDESLDASKENANHHYQFQQKSQTTSTAYYKKKAEGHEKELSQLKKKISFLEQLIIEKDNNAHKYKRQAKRLQKEKIEYDAQITSLKQQIDEIEKFSDDKIKSILETEVKRFEKQCDIFKRALIEKDDQIAKLQKQIRFLSTMLSYWKPLDQMNRNDFLGAKELEDRQEYSQQAKGKKDQSIRKQSQLSERQVAFDFVRQNSMQNQQQVSFKSNREEDVIKRTTGAHSQSHQNVLRVPRERVPQTCSKKSKSTSLKCRKVQPYQIKSLGELLRYRLIGNNYSLQDVRKLFDLAEDVLEEDRQFRAQYITMRQIKNIILGAPFFFNEPQATLISRYVVQDEPCQFVYIDEDNQIKRAIAKSIIKALIGDYQLPNLQEMNHQWQKLKVQYLPNIQSALKIIAPKGVISETKFIELLVGLGIELKDDFKDWMIATMVIRSQSLRELKYRTLIPE